MTRFLLSIPPRSWTTCSPLSARRPLKSLGGSPSCLQPPKNGWRTKGRAATKSSLTEDRLGSVEPGKLADMVVLEADPLQGIQNLRKIRLVVQGGKSYAPDTLLRQARSDAGK